MDVENIDALNPAELDALLERTLDPKVPIEVFYAVLERIGPHEQPTAQGPGPTGTDASAPAQGQVQAHAQAQAQAIGQVQVHVLGQVQVFGQAHAQGQAQQVQAQMQGQVLAQLQAPAPMQAPGGRSAVPVPAPLAASQSVLQPAPQSSPQPAPQPSAAAKPAPSVGPGPQHPQLSQYPPSSPYPQSLQYPQASQYPQSGQHPQTSAPNILPPQTTTFPRQQSNTDPANSLPGSSAQQANPPRAGQPPQVSQMLSSGPSGSSAQTPDGRRVAQHGPPPRGFAAAGSDAETTTVLRAVTDADGPRPSATGAPTTASTGSNAPTRSTASTAPTASAPSNASNAANASTGSELVHSTGAPTAMLPVVPAAELDDRAANPAAPGGRASSGPEAGGDRGEVSTAS